MWMHLSLEVVIIETADFTPVIAAGGAQHAEQTFLHVDYSQRLARLWQGVHFAMRKEQTMIL